MSVKTTPATAKGNQPPWKTLVRFAPRNAESITRKNPATSKATGSFHFHRSWVSTKKRMVVMTMVMVMATP